MVQLNYDRQAVVWYAEKWWNSYNPAFPRFTVDCTNFVSQCVRAGGAPIRGMPNRLNGWWYTTNDWSLSWSTSHSLYWYLMESQTGLTATKLKSATELSLGDVICYDFQGDGRWDHTTIVVQKDSTGNPYVNAHTDNSRHRYWEYRDSAAWTENIQYTFFQIKILS